MDPEKDPLDEEALLDVSKSATLHTAAFFFFVALYYFIFSSPIVFEESSPSQLAVFIRAFGAWSIIRIIVSAIKKDYENSIITLTMAGAAYSFALWSILSTLQSTISVFTYWLCYMPVALYGIGVALLTLHMVKDIAGATVESSDLAFLAMPAENTTDQTPFAESLLKVTAFIIILKGVGSMMRANAAQVHPYLNWLKYVTQFWYAAAVIAAELFMHQSEPNLFLLTSSGIALSCSVILFGFGIWSMVFCTVHVEDGNIDIGHSIMMDWKPLICSLLGMTLFLSQTSQISSRGKSLFYGKGRYEQSNLISSFTMMGVGLVASVGLISSTLQMDTYASPELAALSMVLCSTSSISICVLLRFVTFD